MTAFRTATPAINRGKWRHAVALSEFEPLFLNGVQRSVNRKVQGSNPWSGANCKFEIGLDRDATAMRPLSDCSNSVAICSSCSHRSLHESRESTGREVIGRGTAEGVDTLIAQGAGPRSSLKSIKGH